MCDIIYPCLPHCEVYNICSSSLLLEETKKTIKFFIHIIRKQGALFYVAYHVSFGLYSIYIYIYIYLYIAALAIFSPLSLAPKAPSFAKTGNYNIETFYISKGFPTMYQYIYRLPHIKQYIRQHPLRHRTFLQRLSHDAGGYVSMRLKSNFEFSRVIPNIQGALNFLMGQSFSFLLRGH